MGVFVSALLKRAGRGDYFGWNAGWTLLFPIFTLLVLWSICWNVRCGLLFGFCGRPDTLVLQGVGSSAAGATGVFFFLMPYFSITDESKKGALRIPEVAFSFPIPNTYTIPLRRDREFYRENVHLLYIRIDSAYRRLCDPSHGIGFSIGSISGGYIASFAGQSSYLAVVRLIFYWDTGSIFKNGAQKDTADVFMLGYVVRLPYRGCSNISLEFRMFAPYRMASMVVLCCDIIAVNMDRLNETWKRWGGFRAAIRHSIAAVLSI